MNLRTPEKMMADQMARSAQAKTNTGDFCYRPSCSHPRKDHRDGNGPCDFALVCIWHAYIAGVLAPQIPAG